MCVGGGGGEGGAQTSVPESDCVIEQDKDVKPPKGACITEFFIANVATGPP